VLEHEQLELFMLVDAGTPHSFKLISAFCAVLVFVPMNLCTSSERDWYAWRFKASV